MGRSKFIYGGEVLLDLTADTVEPGKVLLGFKYQDEYKKLLQTLKNEERKAV